MLKTRVIPCLLVKNGKLVKTIQFDKATYIGDPVNAIKIYNEKEVDELVCLDISATVEKRKPSLALIEQIANECFMPLAYGGGIRSIEEVKALFRLGVEKVIVNSYGVENPDFLREITRLFGNQSLVVSIDARKNFFGKYIVYTEGGKKNTGLEVSAWAKRATELGAGEILLTAIQRDGTWQGYDLELIEKVAKTVQVSVIANGGARDVQNFAQAVNAGASAVAAGSMFVYQGKDLGVLINFPSRQKLQTVLQ